MEYSWTDTSRGIKEMDGYIRKEDDAKKLEEMSKEVDTIFGEADQSINNKPFTHIIKGFEKREGGIVIEMKVSDDKDSTFAKYFNMNYGDGRLSGLMGLAELSQKLQQIDEDIVDPQKRFEEADNAKRIFDKKNFLSKMINGNVGKMIIRRRYQANEELKSLQDIRAFLTPLADFMKSISELEKRNGVNVVSSKRAESLVELKKLYLDGLKSKLQ